MADDPINIQVQDNVDPNIASKLTAIGDAAKSSNANLVELRSQLAAINGNNLATLRDQAQTATQAINADLAATNALTQATNNLNTAAANLANRARDEAKATDEQTAALRRQKDAADALARSNAAKEATAAVAPPIITGGAGPAAYAGMTDAQAQEAYAAALAKTAAAQEAARVSAAAMAAGTGTAAKEAVAAAESVGTVGVSFFAKFKTGVGNAFDGLRDLITNNGTAFRTIAPAAEEAGSAIEKVGGHAVGTSTALRELLVLAREGGRGDLTRMAGSASILASALGLLPVALTAAAVGFGIFYAARKDFNTPAEQQYLKDYAESLGLTEKEMRKLSDTTVDANGKLHEHNVLVVTYGDTINGFVATVKQGLEGLFANLGNLPPQIGSVWNSFLTYARAAFVGFSGLVQGVIVLVEDSAINIVRAVQNTVIIIENAVLLSVQAIVNATVEGLNTVGGWINKISELAGKGQIVGTLDEMHVAVKGLTDGTVQYKNTVDDVAKATTAGILSTDRTLKGFTQSWKENTDAAAKARVAALAAAEIANRNPKNAKKASDADPKTQDDYIYEVNSKLDAQLKLYGMLKEARDAQTQLDAIEEAGIKRRMPFSEAELARFKDKIVQIQRNNRVMAEMDTIYTSINGPQQKFQDSQTALLELFVRGNITLTQYNQHLDALKRAYQEATDPLFKINEDLATQAKAYGVVGDALDNLNNQQKVYNAFLAKKIDLTKNATAAELAQAKAAVAELNANDKKKFTDDTVKGVLQPILDNKKLLDNKKSYYDQLNEMAKNNMITENQYTQAKFALDAKLTAAKLQGTSDALDTISQLSSSKNKELAAIGKAAAVANATIKGIEAVQNALAAAPPPFNFALAALVGVATAANVAKIINTPTDTGSYQTGGDFTVNGKIGVDTNRIAMNVSNGERVTIQTVAQQQAARTGQNNGPGGETHVANYFDEASFIAAMDSKHGERVIMNVIGRNPKAVKSVIAGAK